MSNFVLSLILKQICSITCGKINVQLTMFRCRLEASKGHRVGDNADVIRLGEQCTNRQQQAKVVF